MVNLNPCLVDQPKILVQPYTFKQQRPSFGRPVSASVPYTVSAKKSIKPVVSNSIGIEKKKPKINTTKKPVTKLASYTAYRPLTAAKPAPLIQMKKSNITLSKKL